MSLVIDTTDYVGKYQEAHLKDVTSSRTSRLRFILFFISGVIVISNSFKIYPDSLPLLNMPMEPEQDFIFIGVLGLCNVYTLFSYCISYFNDYLRWRLSKSVARYEISRSELTRLSSKCDSLISTFSRDMDSYGVHDHELVEVERWKNAILSEKPQRAFITIQGKFLGFVHLIRFTVLELIAPVIVALLAVFSSIDESVGVLAGVLAF
ncbi:MULTISPECIES: hypothetical protein [unclassified Alcanivorax]|uniref:hypothetical protein n=1 Tax=unclassified Alcanivorax TaxID=2638842 RepID=UPI0007BA1413|nr:MULTISPECIES: hypothetical protein [unclassified Alcanivorax]